MKKNKNKLKKFLLPVALFLGGIVFGFIVGSAIAVNFRTMPEIERKSYYIFIEIAGIIAACYLHIIIHEGGHLVFGLLSGYRFSSFRIGNFMWIKVDGKLRFRRMSLAGTGGQCLMEPPKLVDGKVPVILFNFGGAIANVVFALVFLAVHILTRSIPIIRTVSVFGFAVGIFYAALNGVPLKSGGIVNDGYNAVSLIKEPSGIMSFWYQLKVNEKISSGIRLKDMPEEWFAVPSDEKLKNHIHATIAVFACNRLVDEHRFAEADALMTELLQKETGIIGLYRNALICDMIYCELIGGCRKDRIDRLYTKELKSFMQSMKTHPSVIRTKYAYAAIAENDPAKAYKISLEFDKHTIKYPYIGEVTAELELMRIAEKVSQ